jgi:RNA polymerase-binding protein DksA
MQDTERGRLIDDGWRRRLAAWAGVGGDAPGLVGAEGARGEPRAEASVARTVLMVGLLDDGGSRRGSAGWLDVVRHPDCHPPAPRRNEGEPVVPTPLATPRPVEQLTERELASLRDVLTAELDAQHGQVREHEATVDALAGQLDSDSLLERELADRSRLRALEVITEIQYAIRCIDADEFGACERCGGPIALERLRAIPFTRRCIDCPPGAPPLIG